MSMNNPTQMYVRDLFDFLLNKGYCLIALLSFVSSFWNSCLLRYPYKSRHHSALKLWADEKQLQQGTLSSVRGIITSFIVRVTKVLWMKRAERLVLIYYNWAQASIMAMSKSLLTKMFYSNIRCNG